MKVEDVASNGKIVQKADEDVELDCQLLFDGTFEVAAREGMSRRFTLHHPRMTVGWEDARTLEILVGTLEMLFSVLAKGRLLEML